MGTQWKQYIGTRCLVKDDRYGSLIHEVTVLEVLPSGKQVKFKFLEGRILWDKGWTLIECLGSV